MTQERSNKPEIDPSIVTAFTTTFISRHDQFPIQLENGTYVTVEKPLTEKLIYAHLRGYITIGAYALDSNGWSSWLCFDADDEKNWQKFIKMSQKLAKSNIT